MPRGDGTGPAGMGPMTGRGAGICAGYATPGFSNPAFGRGGFGYGRGWGRGFGRGWGRGLGWRWAGVPVNAAYPYHVSAQTETEALKEEAQFMEQELKAIHARLQELESAKEDQK